VARVSLMRCAAAAPTVAFGASGRTVSQRYPSSRTRRDRADGPYPGATLWPSPGCVPAPRAARRVAGGCSAVCRLALAGEPAQQGGLLLEQVPDLLEQLDLALGRVLGLLWGQVLHGGQGRLAALAPAGLHRRQQPGALVAAHREAHQELEPVPV